MITLDYSPLEQSVTWNDVWKTVKIDPKLVALSAACFVGLLITFGTMAPNAEITIPILTVCITFAIGVVSNDYAKKARHMIRMDRFAAANRATVIRDIDKPDYKGMLFRAGHAQSIEESIILTTDKGAVELGKGKYAVGNDERGAKFCQFGYVRLALSRHLPHMVLDGKKNNPFSLSNLPEIMSGGQQLKLEGNFNEYFTLYAPKEYETDALYIFTPDVMQTLVSMAAGTDVEIVDNELNIYISDTMDLSNRRDIERLMALAATIGARIEHQADYYMDTTAQSRAADVVAEPGRRLKTSYNYIGITIFVLAMVGFSLLAINNAGPSFEMTPEKTIGIIAFVGYVIGMVIYMKRKKL